MIGYRLGHHLPLAPAVLFLYELWGPGLLLFALVILLFPDWPWSCNRPWSLPIYRYG